MSTNPNRDRTHRSTSRSAIRRAVVALIHKPLADQIFFAAEDLLRQCVIVEIGSRLYCRLSVVACIVDCSWRRQPALQDVGGRGGKLRGHAERGHGDPSPPRRSGPGCDTRVRFGRTCWTRSCGPKFCGCLRRLAAAQVADSTRLRASAETLDIVERQRSVRLLVKGRSRQRRHDRDSLLRLRFLGAVANGFRTNGHADDVPDPSKLPFAFRK